MTQTSTMSTPGEVARTPAAPAAAASSLEAGERSRQVEAVLGQLSGLPTLSAIAARVMSLSSTDDANFDEIIQLIEADPSLSARMLSMCRRADVAAARSITTVRRAVVHLGLEAVQSAVLSVEIYEVLGQAAVAREKRGPIAAEATGPVGFDRVGFWRRAVGVACAAEELARQHKALKVKPDEAFTAGLVSDLGKLALDWALPKSYRKCVELAHVRGWEISQAERQVLGVDHHLAGKRLGELWSLPHVMQDSMWLGGQAISALPNVAHRLTIALVTVASALCRRLHIGWSGSADTPPTLAPLCAEIGLEEQQVMAIAPGLHKAIAARCAELGLDPAAPEALVVESIASANRQLTRLHELCQQRVQHGRTGQKIIESIASFTAATAGPAGKRTDEVVCQIARSFTAIARWANAPATFCAVISQSREGEPWRLWQYEPARDALISPAADSTPQAPASEQPSAGSPSPARAVDSLENALRPGSLGGTMSLMNWLRENMAGSSAVGPDVRTLTVLPMTLAPGSSAAIVHDSLLPESVLSGASRDALLNTWARTLASALQAEGSRRLSEELAHAARRLSEAQAQLTEAESMARLGELAAGAAHEMNNPLTVISGRAQVLAQRTIDAKDRADAQQISAAAARLSDLVTSMHLIARPPAPNRQGIAVGELISTLARQIRNAGGGGKEPPAIRVEASAVRQRAMLDPKLFARALGEVLANALQSEPKTGVTIRATVDELDGRLLIEVRDDGQGMSDHALKHAFDPFFSEKKAGRRSGLGLPIARSIVQLHGGDMWMTSEQGVGTSVFLALKGWREESEGADRAAA
ncbi:MAG: HDOD domain-containing protein [Phycisphaerales bacterium]|nr:HDOD domain-containing protein [Phycisphaerales bacterium]